MGSLAASKRRLQGYSEAQLTHADEDLRSMSAYSSTWGGTQFVRCKLGLADFSGALFSNCTFYRCDAYAMNFTGARFKDCLFTDCEMSQSMFRGAILDGVVFEGCRLAYSIFDGATVRAATFNGCNLHGADLSYAECNDATYTDSNLWGAKIALNCSFWNGRFDRRSCDFFAGLLARVYPDGDVKSALHQIAGKQVNVVERLMRSSGEGDVESVAS